MRLWAIVLLLLAAPASTGCVAISSRVVGTEEPVVFKGVSIGVEKIADNRELPLARLAYLFDLPLTLGVDLLMLPFDLIFAPDPNPTWPSRDQAPLPYEVADRPQ